MKINFAVGMLFPCLALTSFAAPPKSSPQGMERTYAQNYRDMVLATCIANAYKGEKNTAMDAGSSVTALREWAYYDLEKSPSAVKALIDKYLARDYTNPLVESEIKGVKFDLLKCLDLYHSKELNALVKEVVIKPDHTYIQDNK
ncbi:type VI secretion system amidase immunity protein Tai4 [Pseudomonas syringae]|uniref:Immunity protein n=1 Tax=Pseudomonas syringae pv. atrofaciens TaxID=192087 RepID=A0AAD0MZH6_PSESX|nr:type VI secretion system amidase immunity protein Tai4 [Pseudomonas syringae]AVX25296.1 hypothetical protein DA456_18830 [Pseudomonas syringae pv. atrofaciens]KPW14314.1 putative immunity protein [Pseudomonas syringae pv. atrofaciens]MBI6817750.1 type VI secretion system amidase immunity protein Tai4 [Pseudomonas syringae]MBI6822312.1 type VI secretion system amidase immunity protein Tai4 [Pseudomonas syringae]